MTGPEYDRVSPFEPKRNGSWWRATVPEAAPLKSYRCPGGETWGRTTQVRP
jgi:hypothetical protein